MTKKHIIHRGITIYDGDFVTGRIKGEYVEGKLSISDRHAEEDGYASVAFLCQDKKNGARADDLKGYRFSWVFGVNDDDTLSSFVEIENVGHNEEESTNEWPEQGDIVKVLERYKIHGEKKPARFKGKVCSVKDNSFFVIPEGGSEENKISVGPKFGDKWKIIERVQEDSNRFAEYAETVKMPQIDLQALADSMFPLQPTNNNKSKSQKIMSTIKRAFQSKEDKAMEYFGLGDSKNLNHNGKAEFLDYIFETGDTTAKGFLKKIVEAYENEKK